VVATLAFQGEIVATRQQRVLLALDEAPILAAETGVLGLSHLVERFAEMTHDVELVEQDRGLRSLRRVTLRNGFHMSITASSSWPLFLGPSQA